MYNEQQELVRPAHGNEPEYVGTPTPELDAAWHNLLGGRLKPALDEAPAAHSQFSLAVNVFVTSDEKLGLGENLYLEPDSQLFMAE